MRRNIWLTLWAILLLVTPGLFNTPAMSKKIMNDPILDNDQSKITVSSNSTDLTVHKIKRVHLLGDAWIIIYWIKSTREYNGHFSDIVWLSDDKNNVHKWFIYEIEHRHIRKGVSGPYITRIFPAPYRGLFYITVKVDVDNEVDEQDMEDNNQKTRQSLFFWLVS